MSTTNEPADMSNSDELVTYLDGEMQPDDCRRVEQRLSADAAYRQELAELDEAWSALDELPRAVATEDFARTTIELVTVTAERESSEQAAVRAKHSWTRMLLATVLGGILAAAGYAAADRLMPDPNDPLIADLPIIVDYDVLSEVRDVEFLRGLSRLEIDELVSDGSASGSPLPPTTTDSWNRPADRQAWIASLSANQRAELAARFSRYHDSSPESQRQRLRQLHEEIISADDRGKLQATLVAYSDWIKNRSPGERITLRELPPDERLEQVEEFIEDDIRSDRRCLSAADERALQEAILDFVARRRQELFREFGERGDPEFRRRAEGQSTAMMALFMIRREMRRDHGRDRLQDMLVSRLSPATQEYLDSLSGRRRGRLLMRWCREALDPQFGARELEDYFVDELDPDERAELLALPRTEMEERLEQLYVGSKVGLRGRKWLDDDDDDDEPRAFDRDDHGRRDRRRHNRDREERRFDDGPPPGPPGGRHRPPHEFDDRRPRPPRFDGPPPRRPRHDRPPGDFPEERPPEPI